MRLEEEGVQLDRFSVVLAQIPDPAALADAVFADLGITDIDKDDD